MINFFTDFRDKFLCVPEIGTLDCEMFHQLPKIFELYQSFPLVISVCTYLLSSFLQMDLTYQQPPKNKISKRYQISLVKKYLLRITLLIFYSIAQLLLLWAIQQWFFQWNKTLSDTFVEGLTQYLQNSWF